MYPKRQKVRGNTMILKHIITFFYENVYKNIIQIMSERWKIPATRYTVHSSDDQWSPFGGNDLKGSMVTFIDAKCL